MDEAIALSQAHRAFLVAPAGCGKTHLIAHAISSGSKGRELILTHTNAGVNALRWKLKLLKVSSSLYHIDTIAGWTLRYAASYPLTSELSTNEPKGGDWIEIYSSATKLLRKTFAQDIIRNSYTGVYVDEYQDCTIQQHALVMELAKLMPCRVLGDPLQGIFDFNDNTIIDWEKDVAKHFEKLPDLTTPWRWKDKNEDLGSWLLKVRNDLLSDKPIDLRNGPICFIPTDPIHSDRVHDETCKNICKNLGSVIVIQPCGNQCHYSSRRLPWLFDCVEPIECPDLFKYAEDIQNTSGIFRVSAILDFAKCCMTQIPLIKPKILSACKKNKMPSETELEKQISLLMAVASESSLKPVLPALKALSEAKISKKEKGKIIPKRAQIYRKELFNEMCRALSEFEVGNYSNLHEAAWHIRNITRHRGRKPNVRSIGTTLLICNSYNLI